LIDSEIKFNAGAFIEFTTGPSGTEEVYSLDFNEANVKKLYELTEDRECAFVVKDLKDSEARNGPLQKTHWIYSFTNHLTFCFKENISRFQPDRNIDRKQLLKA
jgi:hypothetical protein